MLAEDCLHQSGGFLCGGFRQSVVAEDFAESFGCGALFYVYDGIAAVDDLFEGFGPETGLEFVGDYLGSGDDDTDIKGVVEVAEELGTFEGNLVGRGGEWEVKFIGEKEGDFLPFHNAGDIFAKGVNGAVGESEGSPEASQERPVGPAGFEAEVVGIRGVLFAVFGSANGLALAEFTVDEGDLAVVSGDVAGVEYFLCFGCLDEAWGGDTVGEDPLLAEVAYGGDNIVDISFIFSVKKLRDVGTVAVDEFPGRGVVPLVFEHGVEEPNNDLRLVAGIVVIADGLQAVCGDGEGEDGSGYFLFWVHWFLVNF